VVIGSIDGVIRRFAIVGRITRIVLVAPKVPANSSANCCAFCGRSTGALLSAMKIACSTSSGTVGRTTRMLGGCSMRWRAMMAIAFGPLKGGSPESIS
jgi:hypothetical protein